MYFLLPIQGAHKPDPKAFEILIEASGLKPEEICHVGDHPLNDVKEVWIVV